MPARQEKPRRLSAQQAGQPAPRLSSKRGAMFFVRVTVPRAKGQKHDGPRMNTDEHRLRKTGLSVFLCFHPWAQNAFSGFFGSVPKE